MLNNKIIISMMLFFISCSSAYSNGKLELMVADHMEPVFNEIAAEFKKTYRTDMEMSFGPSGLIYDSLINGSKCDIYVSASVRFPLMLLEKKIIIDYRAFGYDEICMVSSNSKINSDNWIKAIIESDITFFTSSPESASLGEYTWEMFENIDREYPGFLKIAISKTNKKNNFNNLIQALIATPNSIGAIYASRANKLQSELNFIKISVPEKYNINTTYCICITKASSNRLAGKFFEFVLSPEGQKILKRNNIKPKFFEANETQP